MWFKESKRCFCKFENFAYGEIDKQSFSNPTPVVWMNLAILSLCTPSIWLAFVPHGNVGSKHVVGCVSSSPGIGKTSLLNSYFLARLPIGSRLSYQPNGSQTKNNGKWFMGKTQGSLSTVLTVTFDGHSPSWHKTLVLSICDNLQNFVQFELSQNLFDIIQRLDIHVVP